VKYADGKRVKIQFQAFRDDKETKALRKKIGKNHKAVCQDGSTAFGGVTHYKAIGNKALTLAK